MTQVQVAKMTTLQIKGRKAQTAVVMNIWKMNKVQLLIQAEGSYLVRKKLRAVRAAARTKLL